MATKIRDSHDAAAVHTELATNNQIIARVTDGIYREPWAAFRELVANAYDADASRVVIETGAPDFDQVTVRDDGIGMSAETIAYILRNIGASSKRRLRGADLHTVRQGAVDFSPGGRPLIGKIGIGLFAVAQLTQHFQIITKARDEPLRISATVRLKTHDEAEHQPDDGYVAGEVTIKSETVVAPDLETHGTSVVLYSLRPEVRRTLQSMRRWTGVLLGEPGTETYQSPPTFHIGCPEIQGHEDSPHRAPNLPWTTRLAAAPEEKFASLVQAAATVTGRPTKAADLDHFDEYLKLIWKLSLSLPLDYPERHPFDIQGRDGLIVLSMEDDSRQATTLELGADEAIRSRLGLTTGTMDGILPFSVTLDGLDLKRPLHHPRTLASDSRVKAPVLLAAKQANPFRAEDLRRAGGPLSFEAYLYWNNQIKPKDNVGVLVRIRDASGTLFDRTFLNYQVSEQTRLRQITAEIFVREGLDAAINIDRESFNYSHPHFLYLQRWLHRSLRLLVNRLKAIAKEDLDREKATRHVEAQRTLLANAADVWYRRRGEEADPPFDLSDNVLPATVGGVDVNWDANDEAAFPLSELRALSVVLEAYDVLSKLSISERRDLLRDVLLVLNSTR